MPKSNQKKQWACCYPATSISLDSLQPTDYLLTMQGRVVAVVMCKQNRHKITVSLPIEALPEGCSPEMKKLYVTGAAVGFALGQQKAESKMAALVRNSREWLLLSEIQEATGYSLTHIRRMFNGDFPNQLSPSLAAAAFTIVANKALVNAPQMPE